MATKAERERAESQRARARVNAAKKKARHDALAQRAKRPASHESGHAGRKATATLEPHAAGTTPTRKSSRKGARHLRGDSALTRREEAIEDSAAFRQSVDAIRTKKVRGHS